MDQQPPAVPPQPAPQAQAAPQSPTAGLLETALAVIKSPRQFYAQMPRTGGFLPPLTFLVVMGIVSGLVQAVLLLAGLQPGAGLSVALVSIILVPALLAVLGFIAAAVLWVIWKVMGSQESYETAYRCMAYSSAIAPINGLLGAIPFVGHPLGLVWSTVLVIIASVEVHKIRPVVAKVVFGGLCALLVLMSLAAQIAGRFFGRVAGQGGQSFQQMADEMKAQALKAQQDAAAAQAQQGLAPGQAPAQPGQPGQAGQLPPNLTPEQQAQLKQMQQNMKNLTQQFQQQLQKSQSQQNQQPQP